MRGRILALSLAVTLVPVISQAQILRDQLTVYANAAATDVIAQNQNSSAREAWQRQLDEARERRQGARKYFLFGAATAGGTLVLVLAGGGPAVGTRATLLSLPPAAFAGWGYYGMKRADAEIARLEANPPRMSEAPSRLSFRW